MAVTVAVMRGVKAGVMSRVTRAASRVGSVGMRMVAAAVASAGVMAMVKAAVAKPFEPVA